jgi:hypothetical protein
MTKECMLDAARRVPAASREGLTMSDSMQAVPEAPSTEAPSVPPRSRRKATLVVGAVALVAVVVGFLSLLGGTPRVQAAAAACGLKPPTFEVADGGNTLVIDGPADVLGSLDLSTGDVPDTGALQAEAKFFKDFECVTKELTVPTYVLTRIGNTTSLAGQQSASWDGMEASWTFHPDNGLDAEIHEEG